VDTLLVNDVTNNNIVAGSGGVSTVYGKPAYQASLTPADNARDLPDVSLFASNGNKQAVWVICSDNVTDGDTSDTYTDCQTSGGQLENNAQFEGVGGTSASSPAFAGMLALVAQSQGGVRLGQANTILYQLAKSKYATVFHDVTVGNNSVPCGSGSGNCGTNGFLTGYNTGTGYDLATGLGSVDVNQLIQNWGSVALTPTATTFSIDGSTAAYTGVHGASVTFNAGVNPTAATGAVAVIDTADVTSGGTTSGAQSNGQLSIALTSGAGTATWNGLPGGTYTVSGRYTGDTSDASSTSTPISVTIAAETSTTSLQVNGYDLNGNASPLTAIPYGDDVLADAQILGKAEGASTEGVATGSVSYVDGSTTVGTATVRAAGNYATFPAPATPYIYAVGSHSLTAKYSGDPSFSASTSAAVAFTVVKASMIMTATEASATVNYNDASDAATVTLSTPYNIGVAPTGTVSMTGNGTTVGTIASLVSSTVPSLWVLKGTGAINGNLLAPGNNVVTLTYSGDANYASTSTTANIESTIGLGSFTIANSGNVSQVAGEAGTTAITVTPAGGFYSQISFACASSGPVTCSASPLTVTGSATVPWTVSISSAVGATLGTYPVTVTGTDQSGKITASTSFNVTLTAVPAGAGIALSNGGPITLTAGGTNNAVAVTVSATNGYVGTVNLTCAVTTSLGSPTSTPTCTAGGPVTVNSARGTVSDLTVATAATTSPGTYTITVTGTDSTTATITANTQFTLTVDAAPAIALSDSGNITVSPGATSGNLSTISVTPANGFTGQVNLTCGVTASPTGATDLPTCNLAPSVNITGTKAVTATLIVSTTGSTSAALDLPLKTFFLGGGGGLLAVVVLFGIPARRRGWRALFSVLALVVIAGAIGCSGGGNSSSGGGGGNSGTTAGAYTITATGTDAATGKVTSSVAVTVTVN
ncbi:MAG: Ig-like domain repeat protein, partial [Acidobacteriaceae bacterium]